MPNQHNISAVEGLTDKLKKAKSIYVTDYLGLSVADVTELRRKFYESSVEYTVVKNTLAKISSKEAELADIDDMLTGPSAIAISYDDPTLPARVIKEFKKDHKLPEVKGFIFEGRVMDRVSFTQIANLPSHEELLTKLVADLSSPMTRIALALKNSMSNMVNVLNNLKETKQS